MDKAFNYLTTLALAALLTSLVLPGRQTGTVVRETLGGLAKLNSSVIGR
jgi:hypothetical protein